MRLFFLGDLSTVVGADVYFTSSESKGPTGLSGQLQDAFFGLVGVDPSDERARGVILFRKGNSSSMGPVDSRRSWKGLWAKHFFQEYLNESGWVHGLNFFS